MPHPISLYFVSDLTARLYEVSDTRLSSQCKNEKGHIETGDFYQHDERGIACFIIRITTEDTCGGTVIFPDAHKITVIKFLP